MIVGLTYFVKKQETFDIWSNGANQNIFFLYHLLKASPLVKEVILINCGDGINKIPDHFDLGQGLNIVSFNDVSDRLDVLIEGGAQISAEQAKIVHDRQGAVVSYRCGNDYVIDTEFLTKNIAKGTYFNGTVFDEIWTHAQHVNTCKHYWQTAMRAPVIEMPHVWSPYFLDHSIAKLKESNPDHSFGYEARLQLHASKRPTSMEKFHEGKTVINMEPNINVVKTSVYPIIISELAYRKNKAPFGNFLFCNTQHLKEQLSFNSYVGKLDLVKDNVATFESRYTFPWVMTLHADVVISHQWENALNYLYYDTLYGHYPLVHNSPFMKNVGYYYEGFDAEDGASALLRAVTEHDLNHESYAKACDDFLNTRLVNNPVNIDAHVSRLVHILNKKRHST
jgi:Protein of unknown function (DUF2827)